MNITAKHSSLAFQTVVAIPAERLIGFGRLILTIFALIAIWLDPLQPTSSSEFSHLLAAVYLGIAALEAYVVMRRPLTGREKLSAHAVDLVCVGFLMYFNQGPVSLFFVFFTFLLLTATLQWDWRGALGTTTLLVLIFFLLIVLVEREMLWTNIGEVGRAIVRPVYLMVAGIMLSYVGAIQEQSRMRLAKLVAWPGPDHEAKNLVPLAPALAHAADIMKASRLLVVWEQPNEPFREVALWTQNGLEHSRERPDRFSTLVHPDRVDESFTYLTQGSERRSGDVGWIDSDLRQTYVIQSALTAPFRLSLCRGRIFLLDRSELADPQDLLLAELIATRIGVDLEHYLLLNERAAAAALRERARLARDLHDGVLQGLTAANIQLKLSSTQANSALVDRLDETRQILAAEQQRIRAFVEGARSGVGTSSEVVDVAVQLDKLQANLERQWGCKISTTIEPPALRMVEGAMRNIRHLIGEAVSNAARHGRASRLEVAIRAAGSRLSITIIDDGAGFSGLDGTYADNDLSAQNLGPTSLRARTKDLGGTMSLRTSSSGTEIHIEIPL